MIKQIDLSAHPGNLDVSYTIRRVETFARYAVPQVGPLGSPAPAAVPALPANPAPAPPASASVAPGAGSPPPAPPGLVVVPSARFSVHDYYHATVVGFFAFGYFKDQAFSKLAASTTIATPPAGCTGMAPDTNCFSPLATNSLFQSDVVMGPLSTFESD